MLRRHSMPSNSTVNNPQQLTESMGDDLEASTRAPNEHRDSENQLGAESMADELEASTRAPIENRDSENKLGAEMHEKGQLASEGSSEEDAIDDFPGNDEYDGLHSRPCDIIDSPNGTRLWIPIVSNEVKPIVGSLYKSFEEANEAYKKYAFAAGFDTRLSTTKGKKGQYSLRYVVCNRNGRSKKNVNVNTVVGDGNKRGAKRNRSFRATNCKAGVKFKLIRGTTSYQLYDFNESHNHMLLEFENMDLSKARRELNFVDQQYIHRVCTSNIGPSIAHRLRALASGGRQQMRGTVAEYRNFWRDMKLYIGERDAQMLVDKMTERMNNVSTFSFEYKVIENELVGLFWADEFSKASYKAFGDVLSFDATYRTNRYKMIFVPFIGADHHKRCVLFGAGLLKSESAESYEWLLRCFLRAHERQPDLVLTDQDPSLKESVANVLDQSVHRLCTWHITNKIPMKMKGGATANKTLRGAIHRLVWNVHLTVDEFEEGWHEVMKEFNMQNHKWLSEMFGMRERWIPGFFRNIPMNCLMRTTSRFESTNSMFRVYSDENNTLVQFMLCYETALEAQRFTQRKLDHETASTTPSFCTELPIERNAASVYTHRIFTEVQKEIRKGIWLCSQTSVETQDGYDVCIIKDKGRLNQRQSEFKVLVKMEDEEYTCSCNNYIRIGFICSHIFCVLHNRGVDHIPDRYIHRRWTRHAVPDDVFKRQEQFKSNNDKVNDLMASSISIVESCVSRLRGSLDMLNCFVDKLKALKAEVFHDVPNEPPENSKEEIFKSLLGVTPPKEVRVKAPVGIRNKGRKRLVGGAEKAKEKKKKRKRKCLYCLKYAGHDIRTCKKRIADEKAKAKGKALEEYEDDYESAQEDEAVEEEEDEETTESRSYE